MFIEKKINGFFNQHVKWCGALSFAIERESSTWAIEQNQDFKSLIVEQEDQMPVPNAAYNYSIEDLWMTKHMQQ